MKELFYAGPRLRSFMIGEITKASENNARSVDKCDPKGSIQINREDIDGVQYPAGVEDMMCLRLFWMAGEDGKACRQEFCPNVSEILTAAGKKIPADDILPDGGVIFGGMSFGE